MLRSGVSQLPETHISSGAIYFDGVKVPGLIAADGVRVVPGGPDGINMVSVTFLCGRVLMDDPSL